MANEFAWPSYPRVGGGVARLLQIAPTGTAGSLSASCIRATGPVALRMPHLVPQSTPPTPTDTNFQLPLYPSKTNNGPAALRVVQRSFRVPIDIQAIPSDTNYQMPQYTLGENKGPAVLRQAQRFHYPVDNQAPPSDTNYQMPGRMPSPRVGPQVLRNKWKAFPQNQLADATDTKYILPTYPPGSVIYKRLRQQSARPRWEVHVIQWTIDATPIGTDAETFETRFKQEFIAPQAPPDARASGRIPKGRHSHGKS